MSNKIIDTDLLRQFITAVYPLKGEELEKLLSGWQPFECKRKTILTAAGETERYLYFVLEGIQRGFYLGKDNQEATDRFMGAITGTYPIPEFFAPENIERIMGAAVSREA